MENTRKPGEERAKHEREEEREYLLFLAGFRTEFTSFHDLTEAPLSVLTAMTRRSGVAQMNVSQPVGSSDRDLWIRMISCGSEMT